MAKLVKPISIEREYEKNPDISPADIRTLRDWVRTQPHLPGEHLTDVDLLVVFHCCEKSFEVTKQVLDLHFTLRTMFTNFTQNRHFDRKAESAFSIMLCAPITEPTVDGHRAVYLRLLDCEPRNFNFVESVRTFLMFFDLWQYEEGTWPGFALVIDLQGTVASHLGRIDLMSLKNVLYFLQECWLTKLKGVHFMNAPSFMDRLMMLLKPFLKKELLQIINIHSVGSETIFKSIPKEGFPKEVGGNNKDFKSLRDDMIKLLRANSSILLEDNKRRVNESLRVGAKPKQVDKEFGLQGSFKKLELD